MTFCWKPAFPVFCKLAHIKPWVCLMIAAKRFVKGKLRYSCNSRTNPSTFIIRLSTRILHVWVCLYLPSFLVQKNHGWSNLWYFLKLHFYFGPKLLLFVCSLAWGSSSCSSRLFLQSILQFYINVVAHGLGLPWEWYQNHLENIRMRKTLMTLQQGSTSVWVGQGRVRIQILNMCIQVI